MVDSEDISNETQRNLQRKFFFGMCVGFIIFLSVNVVQIFFEYVANFGGDVTYGFPYAVYGYWGNGDRGSYSWTPILLNILIAAAFALLLGYGMCIYYKYFRYIPPSILDSTKR